MSKELTWALIVPAKKDWLTKRAKKARKELFPDGARHSQPWEVMGCEEGYSVVLDRTPGSERAHDLPLIRSLAREIDEPMYLLYLNEDATLVEVYKSGKRERTLQEDPYSVAERFGCKLPRAKPARSQRGVVLVEDTSAKEVERALRSGYEDGKIPFVLEDSPGGAIVYDADANDAPPLMFDLSEALPDKNIYTIVTGPGRFMLQAMRGGDYVGSLEIPKTANRGPFPIPQFDSVKGQKTPAKILRALGIPTRVLNIEDQDSQS